MTINDRGVNKFMPPPNWLPSGPDAAGGHDGTDPRKQGTTPQTSPHPDVTDFTACSICFVSVRGRGGGFQV